MIFGNAPFKNIKPARRLFPPKALKETAQSVGSHLDAAAKANNPETQAKELKEAERIVEQAERHCPYRETFELAGAVKAQEALLGLKSSRPSQAKPSSPGTRPKDLVKEIDKALPETLKHSRAEAFNRLTGGQEALMDLLANGSPDVEVKKPLGHLIAEQEEVVADAALAIRELVEKAENLLSRANKLLDTMRPDLDAPHPDLDSAQPDLFRLKKAEALIERSEGKTRKAREILDSFFKREESPVRLSGYVLSEQEVLGPTKIGKTLTKQDEYRRLIDVACQRTVANLDHLRLDILRDIQAWPIETIDEENCEPHLNLLSEYERALARLTDLNASAKIQLDSQKAFVRDTVLPEIKKIGIQIETT